VRHESLMGVKSRVVGGVRADTDPQLGRTAAGCGGY
jgi:hypothetical protein